MRTIFFLALLSGVCVTSGESLSPVFTLDTRYSSDGNVAGSNVAMGSEDSFMGISSVFSLDTGYASCPNPLGGILSLNWWSCAFECDTGAQFTDSDGDGIPDWWEKRYSSDATAKSLVATEDSDNDGLSNLAEFIAFTSPTNASSKFIAHISIVDGNPLISWTPDMNEDGMKTKRQYKIWGKSELMDSTWVYPTNSLHRFFKVTVEMP